MNKPTAFALYVFMILPIIFPGCAGIKLYKDEAMTTRTNMRFYYPKTYLLVEKNPAKDVYVFGLYDGGL